MFESKSFCCESAVIYRRAFYLYVWLLPIVGKHGWEPKHANIAVQHLFDAIDSLHSFIVAACCWCGAEQRTSKQLHRNRRNANSELGLFGDNFLLCSLCPSPSPSLLPSEIQKAGIEVNKFKCSCFVGRKSNLQFVQRKSHATRAAHLENRQTISNERKRKKRKTKSFCRPECYSQNEIITSELFFGFVFPLLERLLRFLPRHGPRKRAEWIYYDLHFRARGSQTESKKRKPILSNGTVSAVRQPHEPTMCDCATMANLVISTISRRIASANEI